ncbi:MAG: DEAD/DEAH box helicase [Steroidobacteraceae bacterium]|nr:DEAD/DEAH box helicase [Steroidobacteraceae bacterium]
MTDQHLSELHFAELDLAPPVMQGIQDAGFDRCTPIQAQTLPIALAGRDVAGQAQTGTGKTAAFLVAIFQRLLAHPPAAGRGPTSVRAIVIAPTRELAVQIHNDALVLGKHTGLKLAVVFGGIDYEKQRRQLADGVDVLIGTPGRIIDYFKQHVYDLRHAQIAVLDEADRMFDLGFIADIRFILRRLPKPDQRQAMLFSATLSHRVLELAYEHMNEPELVRIEPDKVTTDRVRQVIYFPAMEEKLPLLVSLLRQADARRTMVFVNTKRVAERLEAALIANGFAAQAISGDVPQKKRLGFLRDFHNGDLAVLIATDVASRGLHVPEVSHVVNYDLPQDAPDYVHRIGRTARAGAEGDAISFGCEEYAVSLPDIEEYIGRKIPVEAIARDQLPEVTRPAYSAYRPHGATRRGGGRPTGGRAHGGRHGGSSRPGSGSRPGGTRTGGGVGRAGSSGERAGRGGGEAATSPQPPAGSARAADGGTPAGEGGAKRKRRRRGGRGRRGSQGGSGGGDAPGTGGAPAS